jgi:hypothetical protein
MDEVDLIRLAGESDQNSFNCLVTTYQRDSLQGVGELLPAAFCHRNELEEVAVYHRLKSCNARI